MNSIVLIPNSIVVIKHRVWDVVRRMRRPRVDWMTRSDDAILEFLLNEPSRPVVATPAVIAANIQYTSSTVRKRIRELESNGLVTYFDEEKGLYELTELGRDYLAGRLEASDLEDSTDGHG